VLDEVYVPLRARLQPSKRETPEGERGSHPPGGLPQPSLSIAEVLQTHEPPHLLLLGEPGAGKSTLLRQLAMRAWETPGTIGLEGVSFLLLVPLRRLAQREGSVEERFAQVLEGELGLMASLPPPHFLTEWPAQTGTRWLILLDALDEVFADERMGLLQWLAQGPRGTPHRNHRAPVGVIPWRTSGADD